MYYKKLNYKKLMLVVVSALLGASFVQEASAWGTGGSIGTPRKGFETLQLFCDLSDPRSNLTIETTPSNAVPNARPSFKVSGPMVCAEVDILDTTPTLAEAITFVAGSKIGQKAIGVFQFDQITHPALFPGLTYTGPTTAVDGLRTWTFDVTGHESFPFAQLLYELTPLDDAAKEFCDPANLGVAGEPAILDPSNCKALFGLQAPPMAADYPAGRTVNGITLGAGQVSTFSTKTVNNVETPQPLAMATCHTQRFIGPLELNVAALAYSSDISSGNVTGSPLDTMVNVTFPLHVTVQPNDLWNSGPLTSIGAGRFSNADGQINGGPAPLLTTPYKANSNRYLDQLDQDVANYCIANPTECPGGIIPDNIGRNGSATGNGLTAPIGALVGRVGSDYQLLGTNATVLPPLSVAGLELFYWDTLTPDNTGSVKVTIATDSIQCKDEAGEPIPVPQAAITSSTAVEVVYQTELNVKKKSKGPSNFPVHIVGCTLTNPTATYDLDVQTDGFPIIAGETKVFINRSVNPVAIAFTDFHVGDSISRPSCDNGQTVLSGLGTPDFKFDLDEKTVRDRIAPSGVCTNGVNLYKLEIENENGGYSGTGAIVLTNCL